MTFEKISLTDLVVMATIVLAFAANSFTSSANSSEIKEIKDLVLPMQILAQNNERRQGASDELHTQMIQTLKGIQGDANKSKKWEKKHDLKEALKKCAKEGKSVDDCAEALED